MDEKSGRFEDSFLKKVNSIAQDGLNKAAMGFSGMLGQELTVTKPGLRFIPVSEIPEILPGPESEAAGIYLKSEGKFTGQIMLIIPLAKAYELVDMLMGSPTGTTRQMGPMERSALAEVGNLTGSFFLSVIETSTGAEARPTPPAVIVDMVGAILDIVVATSGSVSEEVLLLQATFVCGAREVEANFWVIPDANTLESLRRGSGY